MDLTRKSSRKYKSVKKYIFSCPYGKRYIVKDKDYSSGYRGMLPYLNTWIDKRITTSNIEPVIPSVM